MSEQVELKDQEITQLRERNVELEKEMQDAI